MPHQNRVTPFSSIIADPARGLFMGNRGCLHGADGNIRRNCNGKRWITCLTRFKDRRRALLQPGRYTELFFLDEAVAFAAGHRPCAECRRADYERFQAAWRRAGLPDAPGADAMDFILHAARLDPATGRQRRFDAHAEDLPDGTFALIDGQPALRLRKAFLPWRPGGYSPALPCRIPQTVPVLTPDPFVRIIAAGYRPAIHPSAG
ncbi:hypothetical protein OU426_01970 [Frigidibacter sp. RF13]|uniref:hypothetical protein n=1 Tax=Frigidibacter sp. RF13 TaxID=2997340 RepID=UPI00227028AD|nr:hypothetical protein [Frigidibacter sp. RF13]MCY1125608.1 hypothetical protein [Frigidibacter sp. RF13]